MSLPKESELVTRSWGDCVHSSAPCPEKVQRNSNPRLILTVSRQPKNGHFRATWRRKSRTTLKPQNQRAEALPSPSSSHLSSRSNKTRYYLRLVFSEMCELTNPFLPPLWWEGVDGVGWGVLTLTLEVVSLRPLDSPAGALGAKEGSTTRKDTSALLVFNHGLADQERISSTWPSSPFESPPHPKRNHLPGLWVSPAAGKTPSGWLTRQRQAHNLRHCPARWQTFSWVLSSSTTPQSSRKTAAVSISNPDHTRPGEGGHSHQESRDPGGGSYRGFLKGRAMGLSWQATG